MIGLLLCDRVREKYKAEHGEYSKMFRKLLPNHEFRDYECYKGEIPDSPEECGVWMATGSLHSVYDDIQWVKDLLDFVKRIYYSESKYIGVCFGHQLLGQALGGKVEKAKNGWCVGVHSLDVSQSVEWMQPFADKYNILMMCQDQVVRLPENSTVLGSNENCPVAMFTVGDNMLGIQGHPEFSKAYDRAIFEDRVERIGKEKVDLALESLDRDVNRDLLVKWIEKFILR